MGLASAYRIILRLYPVDYRVRFAQEMQNAFSRTADEYSLLGRAAFVRFILGEFSGLIRCAHAEWMAKMRTDKSVRGRCLPDLRMMRPPGVSQALWFAGAGVTEALEENDALGTVR